MSSPRLPIAAIIPTHGRGDRILTLLGKLHEMDPAPLEIWVHIDASHDDLEKKIVTGFTDVRVLTSESRIGPGGGRDRCLRKCTCEIAASFDDDSFPLDTDYFRTVAQLFGERPKAAVLAATVWHRGDKPEEKQDTIQPVASFAGCGHAIRVAAYRETRGYIERPLAYGVEEVDLSLQLIGRGWEILQSGSLRVLHDTDLSHHENPGITAASIANVGLLSYLRYPVSMWGYGLFQVGNKVKDSISRHRWRGIVIGLLRIPFDCWRYRHLRAPLRREDILHYLSLRRSGSCQ